MRRTMGVASLLIASGACGPSARDDLTPDAAAAADAAAVEVDAPQVVASGPVDVVITADNAYSFGYGTDAAITTGTTMTTAAVPAWSSRNGMSVSATAIGRPMAIR